MKDKTTIKLPKDENPFGRKGHTPHRSGAGIHKDKRTKRIRDKERKALRDNEL